MKWEHPPIIKVYEALGAVADNRIEVDGDTAKVYSSSRNKFYDVSYDSERNAILANDNGSYWKGYLGYPSIAYLFKIGVLDYQPEMGDMMKDVAWKDINQKHKNDFDKTLTEILSLLSEEQVKKLSEYVQDIDEEIKKLGLSFHGKKTQPPKGY